MVSNKQKAHGAGKKRKSPTACSSGGKKNASKSFKTQHYPSKFEKTPTDLDAIVASSKVIWNKLRLHSNTPAQTRALVAELMDLIRGRIRPIALKHDAARVVQAAVQFGTLEDRRTIVAELAATEKEKDPKKGKGGGGSGGMLELCTVQYAHFVILKIIKYCCGPSPSAAAAAKKKDKDITSGKVLGDDTIRNTVVRHCLQGNVLKLSTQANGSRIIELALSTLPSSDAGRLRRELFGREFTPLFSDGGMFGTRDGESKQEHREKAFNVFAKLLQEHRNDVKKRSLLLSHTSSLLHRMIDRSLLSLDYVQHLLWDYYDGLSSDADADLVGTSRADMAAALADHIPHMISSRRGASAACAAFGCAAAKDRKKMMRSLRGYVRSTLEHRDAHLVPLRMILTCDDTVSSKKFILDELLGAPPDPEGGGDPLLDLALHPTAHKMLLVLLSSVDPTTSPHFPPDERVLLAPTMVLVEGKLVSTSRKDPAVRRTELLKHAQTPVATLCRSHARTMMMDRCGAAVLREAFMVLGEEDRLANDVVASVTTEVLEHETGHLTLKRMLAAEVKGEGNGPKSLPLAEAMYKTYGKKLLETIGASNRGAFVLSVLATAGTIGEKVQKEIMKKKCMEKLKKKTGDAQNKKGYEALLAVLKQK